MSDYEQDERDEIRGVIKNYYGFFWSKVNLIFDAWNEGEPELALRRACFLVNFLPVALKDKLKEDVASITKELNTVYDLDGIDFYMTQVRRNSEAEYIALLRLQPFVDKMMRLVDKRNYYMEQRRRKVETNVPASFFEQ